MECLHQFFHIRLAGRYNCRGYPWLGEVDFIYFFGYPFCCECVIGMRIFEFYRYTNVAGSQLINGHSVFTLGNKKLIDSFSYLMVHVVKFITWFHHTGVHFKIRNHAYLGL